MSAAESPVRLVRLLKQGGHLVSPAVAGRVALERNAGERVRHDL